jgi:hypothetical protein
VLDHHEQRPKPRAYSHEKLTRKKATSRAAIDNGFC